MKELDKILGVGSMPTPQSQTLPATGANTAPAKIQVLKPLRAEDDRDQDQKMVEDDFQYARDNIRKSINVAQDAMHQLILLAKETEKPQVYEVLNGYLKTLSTHSKDLLEIHNTKNKASGKIPTNQNSINNSTINNIGQAVFTGTPNDLKKYLEQKQNESKQPD